MDKKSLPVAYAMKKKAKKMDEGGVVRPPPPPPPKPTGSEAGSDTGAKKLGKGWSAAGFADGGLVHEEEASGYDSDLVDRIMKERCMSEGGEVANGGEDELSHLADGKPNEFDDLALDDSLEFHDTGANSGDELGDAREDHDRHDIVSRIMKSRSKKDRLPNPR